MSKSAQITARIDPELKKETEQVFNELGLTTTQAITLFFKQVQRVKGLPFAVLAGETEAGLNQETIAAVEDLIHRRAVKTYASADDLFNDLGI